MYLDSICKLFYYKQEHSESADLHHGSSIPGLSKSTISTEIPFSPLYFIFLLIVIRITLNLFFRDPDSDPDHSQNLITCSLSHLGHILKISSKSVHNLLSYLSLKLHFMDPKDPDNLDHSQNLITSSFYHFRHIRKISSKSVHKFLSYLIHKQTNRRTDKPRRKHNILGGGNKWWYDWFTDNLLFISERRNMKTEKKILELGIKNVHIYIFKLFNG